MAILVNVDTGDLRQDWLHLLLHHLPHELVVHGVLHDLVDVFKACHLAGVGDGRVTAVEQTQLVLLELLDVVDILDHLHTSLLKRWTAVGEMVLDHPLGEGLRDDRPGVVDAKVVCEGRFVGGGSLGGDTVDHGVGEGTLLADPLGKLGVAQTGKRLEHVACDGAVLLHVVAGHDGERLESLLLAAGQGSVEKAEGGAGGLVVGRVEVELDVRVLTLELVRVLVVVVAALGDGERDNVGIRVRHLGNDGLAVVGSKEVGVDAANHMGRAALGGTVDEGVEVVLGAEGVPHGGIKGLQANTTDGVVGRAMLLHQLVDVDRQMSSVEASHANVDDALLDGATALVGWHLTGGGDLRQVGAVELEGSHCEQKNGIEGKNEGKKEMNWRERDREIERTRERELAGAELGGGL